MSQRYYNTSIKNLTYRLRKFKDNLSDTLEDIVRENEDIIVSAVTADQLFEEGIDGRGVTLESIHPYADRTLFRKIRKGQPIDRVTLRDSGRFYDSIYLVYDKGGFYLTSDHRAYPTLRKRYGKALLRLTDDSLNYILNEVIRPELYERFKRAINTKE